MKKFLYLIVVSIFIMSCMNQPKNTYSKIQYEAGACFGFCPIFKITINPDRTALIEAEHFTFSQGRSKDEFSKPREGNFTATVKEADYQKLIKLLNDLNPKSLNSKYGSRNVTDLPTAYLRLTFADGSTKSIEDYGKNGMEKLHELYKFFESLPSSQTWTKVN